MSEMVRLLETASLAPSPANPRKAFDAARLRELATSLREAGVVEPLLVRPRKGARGPSHGRAGRPQGCGGVGAGALRSRGGQGGERDGGGGRNEIGRRRCREAAVERSGEAWKKRRKQKTGRGK